jgi:hypothetical protein
MLEIFFKFEKLIHTLIIILYSFIYRNKALANFEAIKLNVKVYEKKRYKSTTVNILIDLKYQCIG